MKRVLLLILLSGTLIPALANHLKGGFFTYQYLSSDAVKGTSTYHVSLTVYMDCSSETNPGQLTDPINITFFDARTNQIYVNKAVKIAAKYRLSKAHDEECITGNQAVCFYYIVIYDLPSIELPDKVEGYTVSYQRCCRIADIQNMPTSPASSSVGNTYSISIPGTGTPKNGQHNSSATFLVNDTAVVCGSSFFEAPFVAFDPDGDSLSYSFCDAWSGGGSGQGSGPNAATPDPAAAPLSNNPVQYPVIQYAIGFDGSSPLGLQVSIDPKTGVIKGIAPPNPGEYVVTVCVTEFREGVPIARSRKELHLKVGTCNPIQATLNPSYITCDGFTLNFANQTNTGVTDYLWEFGAASAPNNTSNAAKPSFTYADTGTYTVKLVVNRGSACPDSTTTLAKVYPGFFPGFTFAGVCTNKPTRFFDTTSTKYGFVNTWSWNFGDLTTNADTSHLKNPQYIFTSVGTKTINFIVTNSKGCVDTVIKDIEIMDKPPLKVLPKDTLICVGDQVQLHAQGTGLFSWQPGNNISDASSGDPFVNPTTTTNYIVTLDDNGCINKDTSRVRVVSFVTLNMRTDTVICATDSVQLTAVTDGLRFEWTGPGIQDPSRLTTMGLPTGTTSTYQLKSIIGGCNTERSFNVALVPYPGSDAGPDVTVCFDESTQLHAQIKGKSFTWSPVSSLSDPASLDPIARPLNTTSYVLTVTDNIGCPKPGRDTITVTVRAKMKPFAGNDTSVVVNQPLHFEATGGIKYLWTPSTSLDKNNIADPVGIYSGAFDSIRYKVRVTDEANCVDSAFVTVRVFRTQPQVFVPTAFTPNGDGHNDYFRPIPVGITQIEYFRVYNRWGELVYSSTNTEGGWDGRVNGREQGSATYVWMLKGYDYTGKTVMNKGLVTLIR